MFSFDAFLKTSIQTNNFFLRNRMAAFLHIFMLTITRREFENYEKRKTNFNIQTFFERCRTVTFASLLNYNN